MKVLAPKGMKDVGAAIDHQFDHFSYVAAVTADEMILPPVLLFNNAGPAVDLAAQYVASKKLSIKRTPRGYMDSATFVECLEFWEERLQNQSIVGDILLILDGHSSHKSEGATAWCAQRGWSIIVLPSHTTHRLQPLDVSYFQALKRNWRNAMGELERDPTVEFSTVTFDLSERKFEDKAMVAIRKAHIKMNGDDVSSGFKSTGIWPFNADKVNQCTI